jgi:hypothetical protein
LTFQSGKVDYLVRYRNFLHFTLAGETKYLRVQIPFDVDEESQSIIHIDNILPPRAVFYDGEQEETKYEFHLLLGNQRPLDYRAFRGKCLLRMLMFLFYKSLILE